MKKSELRDIIREELNKLNENNPWSQYVMDPVHMIRRSVMNNLLSDKEAKSSKIKKAAQQTAEDLTDDWPKGQGFGSSDQTAAIQRMLNAAGYKTAYVKGMLVRKDIKGGRYK